MLILYKVIFRLTPYASKNQSTFSNYSIKTAAATIPGSLQQGPQVQRVSCRDALLFLARHGHFLHHPRCFVAAGPSHAMSPVSLGPPRRGAQSWRGRVGAASSEGGEGRTKSSREWRSSQQRESFHVPMTKPGQNVQCEGLFFCKEKKYQVIKVMWTANSDKTQFKTNEKQGLWYE